MNIYLLLELVIIIFIISMLVTRDIFSPACIMCESYILAVVCAIWNIEKWDISLHNNTVFVIVMGLVVFCFISCIINYRYNKNRKYVKQEEIKLDFIKYDKRIILLLLGAQALCLLIYFYFFIKSLGDLSRYESFNYMMRYFKLFIGLDGIPTVVNQLIKVSKAITYVFCYIFIHNKIVSKKLSEKKSEYYLLLSIPLFALITLFTGGRFEIMILILAMLMMWYIVSTIYNNHKALSLKTILKIIVILVIAIVLFSFLRTIVGRKNTTSVIDYFTEYFGCSIQALDIYLQEGTNHVTDGRGELFADVLKLLEKFKVIDSRPNNAQLASFVESNGILIGNVYTGFRKMVHDFGIFGVGLFSGIMSIILTIYYEKLKNMKKINIVALSVIFYAAISFTLFLHSYSEFFFSVIISFNYMMFFILLYIVKLIVQKVKF